MRYTDDRGTSQRATAYGRSERDAKQKLREMLGRIDAGQTPKDATITFEPWAERWLEITGVSRRETTHTTYRSLLRTHAYPAFGAARLCDLTPALIEDWVLDLGRRRSASTTRQALIVVATVLDAAVKHELLRRNVARMVQRPRQPRREAVSYSSDEIARLLDEAAGERLEQFLVVSAFTGLRKGEALALRWADVDIDAAFPCLRVTGTLMRSDRGLVRSEPKTYAGRRVVPLVPRAVQALRDQRRAQAADRLAAGPAWTDGGYVFATEIGTPIDPRNALRWFYLVRDRVAIATMTADPVCAHDADSVRVDRACQQCGRKPNDYLRGSLHTLRHSAASALLGAGVPMPVVKDVLGHSSITITVDMYGHLAPTIVASEMTRGMDGYGVGS